MHNGRYALASHTTRERMSFSGALSVSRPPLQRARREQPTANSVKSTPQSRLRSARGDRSRSALVAATFAPPRGEPSSFRCTRANEGRAALHARRRDPLAKPIRSDGPRSSKAQRCNVSGSRPAACGAKHAHDRRTQLASCLRARTKQPRLGTHVALTHLSRGDPAEVSRPSES